jgi:hypothetical protein
MLTLGGTGSNTGHPANYTFNSINLLEGQLVIGSNRDAGTGTLVTANSLILSGNSYVSSIGQVQIEMGRWGDEIVLST